MSRVRINNQNYDVPELTFRHSKILEQCGVPLRRLVDPDLTFTIVSAFVVVVTGQDPFSVDDLIEQHILGGGMIEDIYKAYINAISESHFFMKLLEAQEEKVEKMRAAKKTKATTPNE